MNKIILAAAILMVSGAAVADWSASCKINGVEYPYNSPECSGSGSTAKASRKAASSDIDKLCKVHKTSVQAYLIAEAKRLYPGDEQQQINALTLINFQYKETCGEDLF